MTTTTNTANAAAGTSTGTSSTSTSSSVSSNGDLSSMFTTLLVAQIQNQDPLNPTDPSTFVTQLAQLSQVQSLTTLTTQGTANATMLQTLQAQTLGLQVGSQVSVQTTQMSFAGQPVSGDFTLAANSTATSLVLTNASGVQQSVALGTQSAGDVPFTINPSSLGLAAGTYSVSVKTSTGATPAVNVTGTLNNVKTSASGGATVNVTGVGTVAASSIVAFDGYPSAAAN
jgi:flagellar basal-body rod modification protein FlgD